MKLTYNDIQYIIEQASKIIIQEGRMAFVPNELGDKNNIIYDGYYIQNDKDIPQADIKNQGKPMLVSTENGVFELAVKKTEKKDFYFGTPENQQLKNIVTAFNAGKGFNARLKYCQERDTIPESNRTLFDYLLFLINNPFHCLKFGRNKYEVLKITYYGYDVERLGSLQYSREIDNSKTDNDIARENIFLKNLAEYVSQEPVYAQKYNPNRIQGYNEKNAAHFFINRYDSSLNDGKGGLIYDAINSLVEQHHGYFTFDGGKKVEYINLSHFSVDIAAYLKQSKTGEISNRKKFSGKPIYDADPTDNLSVTDTNHPNFIHHVDNKTVTKDEQGNVVGTKEGDVVYGSDMLAVESAKAMAYVITEKIPDLCAILSIESSGKYNEKTMSHKAEYIKNQDNILYQLQNTFKKDISKIKTKHDFFKKAAHLVEISKECKASKNDLILAYGKKLFEVMKYYEKLDDNTFKNKCVYCNKGENSEILDENGWADFSFMNENYRLSDNPKELILRTFNGKPVKQLYETKEYDKHKWKIKSIPDTVKKYMSFWMKYAFDDTIKNLRTLKEKVKEGSGQNKTGYEDANNDERYRMDEDDSTSGIVIFDDNFATGATTHEAVRLLLDYFNINPNRILCLTPGYMASKTGKEQ